MLGNLAVVLFATTLAATPCANLKSVSLPNTTITLAESVPAGTFTPLGGGGAGGGGQRGGQPAALSVPAFCRIAATLKPSSDSEIDMEVWLPENWNQKFQFVGGGGWAGVISYPAMATALQEGYATASTDTGHKAARQTSPSGIPKSWSISHTARFTSPH